METSPNFDPLKNPDAIALVKQEDGNWKGYMNKNGVVIVVRAVDPQYALQMVLTHE